jgi:hypothetical protein
MKWITRAKVRCSFDASLDKDKLNDPASYCQAQVQSSGRRRET